MPSAKLLFVLILLLGPTFAGGADKDEQAAIDRLSAIADEIRARAAEAEAEIAKTRREARRITEEGDRRAKEIREEADEYVRRVQKHIEEIRSQMPGHVPASVASPAAPAPTKAALAKILAAAVDPTLGCWQRKETESCVWEKIRAGLAAHLPAATCKMDCGK